MAIDVSKIIHAVMEGSKIRESKGIIPLFGVYLSLFSVHFENTSPARVLQASSQYCSGSKESGYKNPAIWSNCGENTDL